MKHRLSSDDIAQAIGHWVLNSSAYAYGTYNARVELTTTEGDVTAEVENHGGCLLRAWG